MTKIKNFGNYNTISQNIINKYNDISEFKIEKNMIYLQKLYNENLLLILFCIIQLYPLTHKNYLDKYYNADKKTSI